MRAIPSRPYHSINGLSALNSGDRRLATGETQDWDTWPNHGILRRSASPHSPLTLLAEPSGHETRTIRPKKDGVASEICAEANCRRENGNVDCSGGALPEVCFARFR